MFRSIQLKATSENHEKTTLPTDSSVNPIKRIKSQELFQHLNELEIDHSGRIYRLRITQFNKLILTA